MVLEILDWLAEAGWYKYKFFPNTQTISGRQQNKIFSITLSLGVICSDTNTFELKAWNFFKDLFTASPPEGNDEGNLEALPTVSPNIKSNLSVDVSDVDILDSLKSMKPYSTPGPDGISTIFYKRHWDLVGDSVIHTVQEAFAFGTI